MKLCLKITAALALVSGAQLARADVLIGVAGPMSGQNAAFGQYIKNGAELAIADINARGGLNGEPLKLLDADDQCDVKRAIEVANQFAAQDVRMVVGHFCSNAAVAAASVYQDRDVVMISPAASHPRLTDQGFQTTLRLAQRDDSQGAAAALRMLQDNAQAVIVAVEDGTPSSKALITKFSSVKVPALTVSIKPGDRNPGAAAQKIRAANPTAIYFASSGSDAGNIVAALTRAGGAYRFYGPDSLLVEAYAERAGPDAAGTLVTFPSDPQSAPDAREAIAALQAKGLTADGATLPAYAAVQAFVAAAQSNSSAAAKDIAAKLKSGTPYKTILGDMTFDTKGDAQPQRYDWYRWSENGFMRVE